MPEDCQPVLITDNEGFQIVAWYVETLKKWHSENHTWFTREVTYWMPIPEIV
jgi:hypothetical protein